MKTSLLYMMIALVMGKTLYTYGNTLTTVPTPSGRQVVSTHSTWFPPHLRGASAFACPPALMEFAKKHGASIVYLIDDKDRCDRSLRRGSDIFVNVRTTYWDSMVLPPWSCRTPAEAITQRFLHEVGHIACQHKGDAAIRSTKNGLLISKLDSVWDALRGQEGEAWKFCFTIRDQEPETYRKLVEAVAAWYAVHEYKDKNWEDDPVKQWNNWNTADIQKDVWASVPSWVKVEFSQIKSN